MGSTHQNLVLTRTGDPDAEAALFSLPLPRGKGGRLAPALDAATLPWPETQTVQTPWGPLTIVAVEADGMNGTFEAAVDFRVRIRTAGGTVATRSRGEIRIPPNP